MGEQPPSTREAIPEAAFIEDIDAYMIKEGSAAAALEKLQRFYSACKMIEQRLTQRKAKLKVKIPEIEATHVSLLQMEAQAKAGDALVTHYELAQSVFAKAKVDALCERGAFIFSLPPPPLLLSEATVALCMATTRDISSPPPPVFLHHVPLWLSLSGSLSGSPSPRPHPFFALPSPPPLTPTPPR